jgi:hypothetical protein
VDGIKLGTLENASLTINGNDEQHITTEGVSYSDGTVTTEVSGDTVVPVVGKTKFLTDALLSKKNVVLQAGLIDGEIFRITMRPLERTFTTDPKTGSLKGSFKFGGGEPDRT